MSLEKLGELTTDDFLTNYWQKKPVLLRQAFKNFKALITPEELAGLALEADVESRLIQDHSTKNTTRYTLEHGPFTEEDFLNLPNERWTLLVQSLDSLSSRFNQLLRQFSFIPLWRLDDIMVSYATKGGSVGPHYDYYDVFLLQASGRRHWQLGQTCSSKSRLVNEHDLKLLADFESVESFVVEPGDLLYIPPNIAHHGIALEPCTTYSIGFRAPSLSDILLDLSEHLAATTQQDLRYTDHFIKHDNKPGKIDSHCVDTLTKLLGNALNNKTIIHEWFAQYMTSPKRELSDSTLDETPIPYQLKPGNRIAYIEVKPHLAKCFINGDMFLCKLKLAEQLSAGEPIDIKEPCSQNIELINHLINQALIYDK